MKIRIVLVSLMSLGVACSEGPGDSDPSDAPNTGRVTGRLSVFEAGFSAGIVGRLPVVAAPTVRPHLDEIRSKLKPGKVEAPSRWPDKRQIVPGQVIVRADAALSASALLRLVEVDGLVAEHLGYATSTMHLVRYLAKDAPIAEARTVALSKRLASRPGIRWASTNDVAYRAAVPNDKAYSYQWHYPAMSLPAAWDVTQGSSAVVVAVLDTGGTKHPDLDPRTVAGIDLITDPETAGDGDGRDDDPTDMGGDSAGGGSSWHGTHVAGTIGAATNNDIGVAGVDWNARLQHVRVLGRGGGTSFDIAAGIAWAAGESVPGLRKNATPATVINMSLGGNGAASPVYQEVIDLAVARGTVIVVAAGNEDENTQLKTPCNQEQVICVGATRHSGRRASYSNFGAQVDVMAPGGESGEDANGDGIPDGVISTYRTQDGEPSLEQVQGTSMATPHVAGLVALMKAVKPTMTPADAERILKQTASSGSVCNEGCGSGLVNAYAAVVAARGQTDTGPARLTLATRELSLSAGSPAVLGVTNTGGQRLDLTATASGEQASRLKFGTGKTLSLAPEASGTLTIDASFDGLAAGSHPAQVVISSNGGSATVNLRLQVKGGSRPDGAVGLMYQDEAGQWQVAAEAVVKAADGYAFSLVAPPGTYYVFAGIDSNGDNELGDGEPLGMYLSLSNPKQINVVAGEHLQGINFTVAPTTSLEDPPDDVPVGASCGNDAACGSGGTCDTSVPGGYCSRPCGMAPCPGGSACYGDQSEQWCLATCSGPGAGRSDCRAGFVCQDDYAGGALCLPRCSGDESCPDGTRCDASGYCEESGGGGTLVVGATCTATSGCPGGACDTSIRGGYCTVSCVNADCPTGAACYGDTEEAWCLATCDEPWSGQDACRPGLVCLPDIDYEGFCSEACLSDDDCPVGEACDEDGYCW